MAKKIGPYSLKRRPDQKRDYIRQTRAITHAMMTYVSMLDYDQENAIICLKKCRRAHDFITNNFIGLKKCKI